MRHYLLKAGMKLLIGAALLSLSYYSVNHSNFYYLFIGNIFLLAGLAVSTEAIISFLFTFFKTLRNRETAMLSTSRSMFIVIFIADLLIRFSGVMQAQSEKVEGRYFSLANQENLDSWYWTHTPNTEMENEKKEFTFKRSVNSLGLSEREIEKEKGKKLRILAIGDSFTEGVGTSYQDTWVKKMESRWKDHKVETMNAGIGGSDPLYEFALYRDKLLEYRPDLVILTINSSDIIDVSARGGFERFHEDGTAGKPAPNWEWVYAANHLFRMIMDRLFGYNSVLVQGSETDESKEQAVRDIKEAIGRFDQLTTTQNTALLVVIHPSLQEFQDGKHRPFFGQLELVKYMKSKGIECLDVTNEFEKKGMAVDEYYYPIDTHFNKKGYALFGETVYEKIEELEILNELN